MSIKRAPRNSNFTIVSNEIFSANLSARAIGVLVYLLSKPDHWEVRTSHLVKEFQGTVRPEGRDSIYAIITELKDKGFIQRIPCRKDGGLMNGYDYQVSDTRSSSEPEIALPAKTDKMSINAPKRPSLEEVKKTDLTAQPFTSQPETAGPLTAETTLVKTKKEVRPDKGAKTDDLLLFPDDKTMPPKKTVQLFEQWYAAYPRKVSRGAAERAYAKAISKGVDPALMLSALKAFSFDFKEEGKFIPHPATWLNDGRYLDKPVSIPAKGKRLIYCGQLINPAYYYPNTREQVLAQPVPAVGHKDREAYLDAQNGSVAMLPKGEWK